MLPRNLTFVLFALACAFITESSPVLYERSTEWLRQNGPTAKALNDQYTSLTASSSCLYNGDEACVDNLYAVCHHGQYITHPCPAGWSCAAIPSEWKEGTTTTCNPDDKIASLFRRAGITDFKLHASTEHNSRPESNGPGDKGINGQHPTLITGWGGTNWCGQKSCGNQGKYQLLHREARDAAITLRYGL